MTVFKQKEWEWAVKARHLLESYRSIIAPDYERGIYVSEQRADRLQQAIAEALFKAYNAGVDSQLMAARLDGSAETRADTGAQTPSA